MRTKDITDRDVCLAYEDYRRSREMYPNASNVLMTHDYLMLRTGAPFKVCDSAMKRACKRGLVDYGVSLRTGWLTEKGKELLKETACTTNG